MPVGSCQLPPPLTHSPRLVTQASRHSALGGTLSEEMGAFGCLALELREAAPRVRARNHRSNWPCQAGQPEPPKAGLLHSRCPPLGLNITMSVCACVRVWRAVLQGSTVVPPARVQGMQGTLWLVREPSPEGVNGSGSPFLPFSQALPPPPWALESFAMNSTGAIFFVLFLGDPHLLKSV